MPYQFFLNLPFGETMVEMHSFTENYASPYKFNGKELDSETGMYYYGARYYDPKISIWSSVDPLAQKYQGWNPYNYTMQNPINLIDPDGMRVVSYQNDTDYKVITSGDDKGKIVRADSNDGSDRNAIDRILDTDKKGKVSTKVLVDNIAKGIITEEMNMRTDAQFIKVEGEGQPKRDDVMKFLVDFSEYVANKEISGFEGISMDNKQDLIMTEPYINNTYTTNISLVLGFNDFKSIGKNSIFVKAHFHTHPFKHGFGSDIDEPSQNDNIGKDLRHRKNLENKLPHFIYNINGRKSY